mgnify:CR=1 FL=1
MRIHRELAAFALVHEEYEKSGSVINGLTPIFAPALAEQRGSLFSPAQFAKDVERLYDIPMTAIAAEGMAPKLRAAGLLIEEEDSAGTGIYRVARSIEVPDADLGEDVVGLLETFVEFASYELSRHGLSAGRDQIREVFLDVIKSQDFLLRIGSSQIDYYKSGRLSLNSSIESEESDTECNEDRLESAIYLLSAQYISSINRPESAQFATLNKLVTGALLAEVVMTLRVPSGVDSMDSTQIFIDTPLVLDLLDLSTPEHKSYAEQLFKVLNDASCKVFLFSHSLEEAKEAIRAPLSLLAGGTEPHGPLGFRLMHEPGHLAYTRTVLGSLAERITELGIAIYDSDEIATDKSYRAANLEERVLPYVGEMHYDVRPRLRDVQSISYTWYLRADYNPETLIDSRAVFVTRNAGLSRSVQRFFRRDDEFGEAIFPAIITDRELACLFWFIGGGDLRRITEARLVANCAAAVEPRLNMAISGSRKALISQFA